MPNWKDEYLGSLKGAELNNPVNMELVQTCNSPSLSSPSHSEADAANSQAPKWPTESLPSRQSAPR